MSRTVSSERDIFQRKTILTYISRTVFDIHVTNCLSQTCHELSFTTKLMSQREKSFTWTSQTKCHELYHLRETSFKERHLSHTCHELSFTYISRTVFHMNDTNCLSHTCHKERRLPHECYKLNVTNYMSRTVSSKRQVFQIRTCANTDLFQTNQRQTQSRSLSN